MVGTMAMMQGAPRTGRRSGLPVETAARWSLVGAVLLGLAAAADLVRWGNRWHVTEVFARDAGAPGGAAWEYVYAMLHDAHEALVRGLVLLLISAALAAAHVVIRRRTAR
jgi:multisubunit Na+/H+ antiporter MnhB subunit